MDDRILLVPSIFAPDPDALAEWPALGVLFSRLRALLPLDFVRWPTLQGEPMIGEGWKSMVNAVRAVQRAEHHVVDISIASGALLVGLAKTPPRSLVMAGFVGSPASLRAHGYPDRASAANLAYSILINPAQLIPVVMQGASEDELAAAAAGIEATIDKVRLATVSESAAATDFSVMVSLDVPALYLSLPPPLPGGDIEFGILQTMLPRAQRASLESWPLRVHSEETGHELADRVCGFIKERLRDGT